MTIAAIKAIDLAGDRVYIYALGAHTRALRVYELIKPISPQNIIHFVEHVELLPE